MKTHPHTLLAPFGRCLLLAMLVVLSAQLNAGDLRYLKTNSLDVVALLAPPPAFDSAEQTADLATVELAHKQASSNELALAVSEENFTVFSFTPAIGSFFKSGKLAKTEKFFRRLQTESDSVVVGAKGKWKRIRPLNLDPTLYPAANDKSFSYPSGHSTRATVYALLLADIFPDRSEAILAEGRTLGWHRVELGKHFFTDVFAGRVLGRSMVRELKTSPKFQREFAKVKAELLAAEKESLETKNQLPAPVLQGSAPSHL